MKLPRVSPWRAALLMCGGAAHLWCSRVSFDSCLISSCLLNGILPVVKVHYNQVMVLTAVCSGVVFSPHHIETNISTSGTQIFSVCAQYTKCKVDRVARRMQGHVEVITDGPVVCGMWLFLTVWSSSHFLMEMIHMVLHLITLFIKAGNTQNNIPMASLAVVASLFTSVASHPRCFHIST